MNNNKLKNPFIGMRPYDESEKNIFFGRKKQTDSLLTSIDLNGACLLYAKTGVGKSSLLRAGLIPRLKENINVFPILINNWHDGFLKSISIKLEIEEPDCEDDFINKIKKKVYNDSSLIIILDQFEEILLRSNDEDIKSIANYLAAVVNSNCPAGIVLCMREEFLAEMTLISREIRAIRENQYRLEGFTVEQATTTLQEIAKSSETKISWSKYLSSQVSDSVFSKNILSASFSNYLHMGIVQVVSMYLFENAIKKRKDKITVKDLVDAGGVDGIIDKFTKDKMNEILDDDDQSLFAGITKYLFTPSGVKISVTLDDLAHNFRFEDIPAFKRSILIKNMGASKIKKPLMHGELRKKLQNILDKLEKNKLFINRQGFNTKDYVYSIQHDVATLLLTRWKSILFRENLDTNWNSYAFNVAKSGKLEYYYYAVNEKLPNCLLSIVKNLSQQVRKITKVKTIKLAQKTPVTISQLLEDIMAFNYPILDIAYRDENRTGHSTFYKIGTLDKCVLVFHRNDENLIKSSFNVKEIFTNNEPEWFSSHNKFPTISNIFNIADSVEPTPLGIYCQTSTTIENELFRISSDWISKKKEFKRVTMKYSDVPFGSDRDLRAILNSVIFSHQISNDLNQMKYIALVDWPLYKNNLDSIKRYAEHLAFLPVSYEKPIDAGFFLPPNDEQFSKIVADCIDKAIFKNNKWHNEFKPYAQRNLISLMDFPERDFFME